MTRGWLAWHIASANDPKKWRVDSSASAIDARLANAHLCRLSVSSMNGCHPPATGTMKASEMPSRGQRAPNLHGGQVLARPSGAIYRDAVRV